MLKDTHAFGIFQSNFGTHQAGHIVIDAVDVPRDRRGGTHHLRLTASSFRVQSQRTEGNKRYGSVLTDEYFNGSAVPVACPGTIPSLPEYRPYELTDDSPDLPTAVYTSMPMDEAMESFQDGAFSPAEDDTYEARRAANTSLTVRDYILYYSPRYARPQDAKILARRGSVWRTLIRCFKNAQLKDIMRADSEAPCLLSAVYTRNCLYLDESLSECAARVGIA